KGPIIVAIISGVLLFGLTAVLIDAWMLSGDFLGFLPDGTRATIERWHDIPPPAAGEDRVWTLQFVPYMLDERSDRWMIAGMALAALAMLFLVYRAEPEQAGGAYKFLMGGLRLGLILLTLIVFLGAAQLRFDRQSWPDVVVLIDTSRSMGE